VNPETPTWNAARVIVAVRRFWWLITALAIVGGGVAFGASAATTPIFESTASLYFTLDIGATAGDLNQGATYTQNQMLSYGQLATSSRVLQPVIDELGLDTTPRVLARTIAVSIPQSTVVLEVQASSPRAGEAADIANAVTRSLVTVVGEIASTGADSTPSVKAEIIDEAVVPRVQALPNKTLDAAIGLFIGLLVGLIAAFLGTQFDTRIRTVAVLIEAVGKPVLGTVAKRGRGRPRVDTDPLSQTSEDFRRIRSSLTYASLNEPIRSLLVTSTLPGEGKTTVATNLARSFADPQRRTLLVDGDLRKPRVGEYLGVEGSIGLTTVLVGEIAFDDARISWGSPSFDLLASGEIPPNPAEVLTSTAMRRMLDGAATAAYDHIVVDSPPVLSVADATLMGPIVDGVVVVVDARRTRRHHAVQAVRELEAGGARVIGMILNNVEPPRASRSRYYQEVKDRDARV
jgi:capsular exopolysaccharide synthesis family protein